MKAFPQFTREYIRKELSYENLMYLMNVLPPYRGSEDTGTAKKSKKNEPSISNIKHWDQFNF